MKTKKSFFPVFLVAFVILCGISVLAQDEALSQSEPISWEMAKQIIQSQSNLAMLGITVLVGIAVLLMAGNWILNIYIHKQELQKITESLSKRIDKKQEEALENLTKKLEDNTAKIKKEVEESIDKRMILFDADKARLFALVNRQSEKWENSASWLATAIIDYAKIGKDKMLRISVDALNEDLKECKELKDKNKELIKKCLHFIPETLSKEREQIKETLNSLPTKSKTSEGEIK